MKCGWLNSVRLIIGCVCQCFVLMNVVSSVVVSVNWLSVVFDSQLCDGVLISVVIVQVSVVLNSRLLVVFMCFVCGLFDLLIVMCVLVVSSRQMGRFSRNIQCYLIYCVIVLLMSGVMVVVIFMYMFQIVYVWVCLWLFGKWFVIIVSVVVSSSVVLLFFIVCVVISQLVDGVMLQLSDVIRNSVSFVKSICLCLKWLVSLLVGSRYVVNVVMYVFMIYLILVKFV